VKGCSAPCCCGRPVRGSVPRSHTQSAHQMRGIVTTLPLAEANPRQRQPHTPAACTQHAAQGRGDRTTAAVGAPPAGHARAAAAHTQGVRCKPVLTPLRLRVPLPCVCAVIRMPPPGRQQQQRCVCGAHPPRQPRANMRHLTSTHTGAGASDSSCGIVQQHWLEGHTGATVSGQGGWRHEAGSTHRYMLHDNDSGAAHKDTHALLADSSATAANSHANKQ
jgi:hypothetical protein